MHSAKHTAVRQNPIGRVVHRRVFAEGLITPAFADSNSNNPVAP